MDRALFATGGLLFSTHVAHHLVAGDESGALFVGCLLFTVGVLALPVAATGNRRSRRPLPWLPARWRRPAASAITSWLR
jgi:hypothetical protein